MKLVMQDGLCLTGSLRRLVTVPLIAGARAIAAWRLTGEPNCPQNEMT